MIADDGFAGAGGWDLAARQLGIEARGIENMKEARATRDAAGLVTIHDDVWTFQPDGKAVGKIDSPPCQTFSAAGKGVGRKALEDVLRGIRDSYYTDLDHLRFLGMEVGDERTALVLTPLHFATQHEYEWLAWEQVPTVLPVWEACAVVLRAQGWHVWTGLLHAEQYGVPQTRKRAFLLASRHHEVRPPTPTHSRYYSRSPERLDPGVQKWVSMAEALGWGLRERPSPTVTGGGTETGGAEPIAKWDRYTSRPDYLMPTIEWMASPSGVTGPVHRPMAHPAETVTGKGNYYAYGERPDFLRMTKMPNSAQRNLGQPAPTVAFGHDAASCRWFADGRPVRRIAIHEAGVLQSFPADYPWQGAKGKQYLQCGNAVPPGLALHALAAAAGIDAREVAA